MRSKIVALFSVLVLAFAGVFAGAGIAHADTFMDPPRSGASVGPLDQYAKYERKCTFGSGGYILMRARVFLGTNGSGNTAEIKGIQLFNRYNNDEVAKIQSQYFEDDRGRYNAANVAFSIPQGGKAYPDWFGTGQSTDFYPWNTGTGHVRQYVDRVAWTAKVVFPHVSSTVHTCPLIINSTYRVS